MSNISVSYLVPLIPQTTTLTCWFAAAQMVTEYSSQRDQKSTSEQSNLAMLGRRYDVFRVNQRLPYSAVVSFANDVGLRIANLSNACEDLPATLQRCGPLWYMGRWRDDKAGNGHAVVITGISDDAISVNDPLPVNQGTRRELPLQPFFDYLRELSTVPFLYA